MDLHNKKPLESKSYAHGGLYETDDRFHSWTSALASDGIGEIIKQVHKQGHPIDTHFLYLNIIESTYKQRKDPQMKNLFKKMALEHISVFDLLEPVLYYKSGNNEDARLPRVPTFQYLATVYAEDGEFAEAIEVCKRAIGFGLEDGTKGGFPGRIERIKKKAAGKHYDLQNENNLEIKIQEEQRLRSAIEEGYSLIRKKSLDLAKNRRYDCVEITSYPTSCSSCRPYQGHTFSISGKDPDFPPLSDAIASGLFHEGCHHLINVSTAAIEHDIGKFREKDAGRNSGVNIKVENKTKVEGKQKKGGFLKRFGL
jgi:hypothetical protein